MVILQAGSAPDEWHSNETYYRTNYSHYNGYVQRIPLLRQIVDIRAASVCASFRIRGTHDKAAEKILAGMEGRGTETFKLIMSNMYKTAWICGDSYAEIVYENEEPINLEILPSDNIRQIIKKGRIIAFEEIDGSNKWRPQEILHFPYAKRGAMTHGLGMVEVMQNLLLEYEQMTQLGSEIYRNMSKPREIIFANTDNQAKLDIVREAFRKAGTTFNSPVVLPKTLIEDYKDVQLSVSLKPQEWLEVLRKEICIGTAVPELVLGIGYSTSEDDAKTRMGGFRGSIRFDQKWLEELIQQQLLAQMYPDNTPSIEWSYATEAQDERFNRNINAINALVGTVNQVDPQTGRPIIAVPNVVELIKERLEEAGMLE